MVSIMEEEAIGETEFAGGNPIPNEESRPDQKDHHALHSDVPLSAASTQDHENSLNHDPEKALPAATAESSNEKTQEEKDPNVLDWNGPDDPDKPINWPTKKKWPNVAVISALTFLTPLASSMFAPGVPQVMDEFKSSNLELASFIVSVYILGYACGPLFIAPLSEMYGRLPIYHVNNCLFIVFNIACAESTSLSMLIVFRFLAGTVGSTPLAIGSGTIADLFKQEERGKVMAIWALGPLFGPVIGPVAGGYLSNAKGWRWDFWILTMAGGLVFAISLLVARETYAPVLLSRRVARLRKETGNPNLRAAGAHASLSPRQLFWLSIVRPAKMLIFLPIVLGLSLFIAVAYGYLYLLFTTMTEVFEGQYGFSAGNVGLTYLGIGVGSLLGLGFCGFISDRLLKSLAKKNGGEMKPEYRLPPLIIGGFLLPMGLFWYGWTADKKVHWILPILGTMWVGIGLMTLFMPIGTYLVDAYPVYAASAMAGNTVLRSLGGALLPLCGRQMYQTLGLGWGNSLLGFIALGMTPMIWVFMKYGERIRKSPRFQLEL